MRRTIVYFEWDIASVSLYLKSQLTESSVCYEVLQCFDLYLCQTEFALWLTEYLVIHARFPSQYIRRSTEYFKRDIASVCKTDFVVVLLFTEFSSDIKITVELCTIKQLELCIR